MPAHYICDGGCGATTANPDEWPEHGYAHRTRYCPDCEQRVIAHEQERDELHNKLQELWQTGMQKVNKVYLKDHPKGILPDVGD